MGTEVEITRTSEHEPGTDLAEEGVGEPSLAYKHAERDRVIPRVLAQGTKSVREHALATKKTLNALVPQEAGETDPEYKRRIARTTVVNIFLEAVQQLAAKPFSKPLVTDVPPFMEAFWLDVDGRGTDGNAFLQERAEVYLQEGSAYILTEYPNLDPNLTAAQEREIAPRPYWVPVDPENVIDYVEAFENGRYRVQRARIKEIVTEPHGKWGEKEIEQIRAYWAPSDGEEFATFQLFRRVEDEEQGESWVPVQEEPEPLIGQTEVPIAQLGEPFGEPPLLNLAYQQVQHVQKKSDLDNILHVVNVPALVAAGFDPEEIQDQLEVVQWGPFRVFVAKDHRASIDVVEHSGHAIGAAQKDIESLENHMRMAALEPMIRKATGDEKATIRSLDEAKANSRLQSEALNWLNGANRALEFTAKWMGEEDGGTVSIPDEVFRTLAAPSNFETLLKMAMAGKLSDETLLVAAQRYGLLWDDLEVDEEIARIEMQGPDLALPPLETGPEALLEDEDDDDERMTA